MSKIKTALHAFFATLDADLSHDLAAALADKINCKTNGKLALTAQDIFCEYEAWQIA